MSLLPQPRVFRIAALVWLLLALALLVVMLLRPDLQANERKALSVLVPLYFMSFPLGHAGLEAMIWLKVQLYAFNEFVPAVYIESIWLWTLLTVLGYVQWFVLPPLVSSRIRRFGSAYMAWWAAAR